MSIKKRATKSIALSLVGITVATPFLNSVSAMEDSYSSSREMNTIALNKQINQNTSYDNIYTVKDNTFLERYKHYKLNLDSNENVSKRENEQIWNTITSVAQKEVIDVKGIDLISYETDFFNKYISNCKEVIEVIKMSDKVYISYKTTEDELVILTYSQNGLVGQTIYDTRLDKVILIEETSTTVYENFGSSSIHEISPEQNEAIDAAIESGDIDKINSIPGIYVENIGNSIVIDFEGDELSRIEKAAKTNFVEPSKQFVPYTKRVVSSQNKYCSALKKNIKI